MVLLQCLLAVIFACKVTHVVSSRSLEMVQPFFLVLQNFASSKRSLYEFATILVILLMEGILHQLIQ